MGDLQLVWLHPAGWTLTILGGTLLALSIVIPMPPPQRRVLLAIFSVLLTIGALALLVYFVFNRDAVLYNEL